MRTIPASLYIPEVEWLHYLAMRGKPWLSCWPPSGFPCGDTDIGGAGLRRCDSPEGHHAQRTHGRGNQRLARGLSEAAVANEWLRGRPD